LIYPKHKVKFNWVKGHAGNEYNEICDTLAVEAADGDNLLVDKGYEDSKETGLF
jgi:ribonuclease HI